MREDWIRIELGKIIKVSSGNGLTANKMSGNGYPVYGGNGITGYHSEYLFEDPKLIIGRVGVRCGVTHITKPKSWVTDNALVVNFKIDGFDLKFMQYKLQFENLNKISNSTAQPVISGSKIYAYTIWIPPLPEQRAIVAKIEQLFSELDNGIANLKAAKDKLEIYRQAVLKKAFEGEFEIKKIKEVCENIKVGIVIKPTQYYSIEEDGVPAFRSANVREFKIENANWVYFTKDGNRQNSRTQIKENDVLIVRSGYPGTSCVVPKKYEGSNAIDILIATPDQRQIHAKYLCAFNNSPLGKGLFRAGSRGVAQQHLNVGIYSNLNIPVPSIEQQSDILQEIETRLSVCDNILTNIEEGLEKTEALRQSILKQAFEGKLLNETELQACRKESDWEPAEKLLSRIKLEKEKL
ncbi:MAG: restriction endonuclease subunit S [Lewinellaceae bacterium]|nr:restriction endonuclease subunit S [Lewinellaceae bacterium]